MRTILFFTLLLLAILTLGILLWDETDVISGNSSDYKLLGKHYKVLPFSHNFTQTGVASWYGDAFQGKKTANGEIYDMYAMTAAHKTLPIPSYVNVSNLKNARSVIVRINDRGPYHQNRIIDLSYAAAKKIGLYQRGTGKVKITAINAINNNSPIYLQIGVFEKASNAYNLQHKVSRNALPSPIIKKIDYPNQTLYKVQIGPLYKTSDIDKLTLKLTQLGISKMRYVR
ncbi:MAG: septal ring lytic transglycosylase RlpA family protein [Methylococcales bacterium]|nr:septal ring lytic transglycosylase RlpA family protein [Methylococcales bacterium]